MHLLFEHSNAVAQPLSGIANLIEGTAEGCVDTTTLLSGHVLSQIELYILIEHGTYRLLLLKIDRYPWSA